MTDLEPLDDSEFKRVLVVVAHPDDAEYGTSAAVSRWTAQGIEVAYLLLTKGEAGMQRPPAEVGPIRMEEQRRACAAVGVSDLTILDFPDGMLTYSLDLRKAIAKRIRELKPDVVIGSGWEVEAPWGLDQADHRAAGLSTLDAIRDADNTWVHPELAEEGLQKWGVKWLLVSASATPTNYVEIDDPMFDAAVASLGAHEQYFADLPWHPAPADFLGGMFAAMGQRVGAPRAVLFHAYQLGS